MMYNVGNFKESYLAEAMDDSQTTMQLISGGGDDVPTPPTVLIIAKSRNLIDLKQGEVIIVDSVDGGDPDLFNITRSASPTTHAIGDIVMNTTLAEIYDQMVVEILLGFKIMTKLAGDIDSGVIRETYDSTDDLQVVASSTPDEYVKVLPGCAVVKYYPIEIITEQVLGPITAPAAGYDRKDRIQINKNGVCSIKTGTPILQPSDPALPAVDADAMPLGYIYLTPSEPPIENGDITDERNNF